MRRMRSKSCFEWCATFRCSFFNSAWLVILPGTHYVHHSVTPKLHYEGWCLFSWNVPNHYCFWLWNFTLCRGVSPSIWVVICAWFGHKLGLCKLAIPHRNFFFFLHSDAIESRILAIKALHKNIQPHWHAVTFCSVRGKNNKWYSYYKQPFSRFSSQHAK